MKRSIGILCLTAVMVLFCAAQASADTIAVDENGSGLPFTIGADPGPGGLANVLTYLLPFAGTQGDLALTDADVNNFPLDIIRFNGDGTMIFYSDNIGGADSLADTAGPPSAFYANFLSTPELGAEGSNGAVYTPLPGQPGYDVSGPTYNLVSDETLPEPGSLALFGGGIGLLALKLRRKKRRQAC